MRSALCRHLQRALTITSTTDLVSGLTENLYHQIKDVAIVIDHENGLWRIILRITHGCLPICMRSIDALRDKLIQFSLATQRSKLFERTELVLPNGFMRKSDF